MSRSGEFVDDRNTLGAFERLRHDFGDRLASVAGLVDPALVRSDWSERNAELAAGLLPVPPADFLRHPAILYQMFVDARHLPAELPYVLAGLSSVSLAAEDAIGSPPTTTLDGYGIVTSSNLIHHLHHLLRYQASTGTAISDLGVVVEWGGGFGSLAKLFLRLHGGPLTYVILDTPVFSALQWLYLSSIVGEEAVVLHDRADMAIVPGCVNVVPISLAASLAVPADLFVSTWALNESTKAAQDLVLERSWYGARSLLMAMHHGDPMTPVVVAHGARSEPVVETMPGQRYLFR